MTVAGRYPGRVDARPSLATAAIVGGVSALGFIVLALAVREFGRSRRPDAGREAEAQSPEARPIYRGQMAESDRVLRAIRARPDLEEYALPRPREADAR